jgi:hypothetical protein
MKKIQYAERIGPDAYDTREQGTHEVLHNVPYAYLLSCAKAGLRVKIDQADYISLNGLLNQPPSYWLEMEE